MTKWSCIILWLFLEMGSQGLATDCSKFTDLLAPITKDIEQSGDFDKSPGIVFQAIWKDDVIYSHCYGLSNIEKKTPLTPSAPIRLASLSKAFTAMAIMMLAEEGMLCIDTPAYTIIPELSRFKKVTIRHLLNHTSGLPDYYDSKVLESYSDDKKRTLRNEDMVSLYKDWGEPAFTPGSQFMYSNPGYEVLALVIERVSKMTYRDYLNSHIFTPLGMTNSVVRDDPSVIIEGSALGYGKDKDEDKSWILHDAHWANGLLGAGGVYASLNDLGKWAKAIRTHSLVSDAMATQAFSPATLSNGEFSSYGFGWDLSEIMGHKAIHHTGSWVGFRTAIAIFPENDLAIIVLSNSGAANSAMLRNAIAKILLKALKCDQPGK